MSKNITTQAAKPHATSSVRPHTKAARLLDLLRTGTGASLDDMVDATGWQAHTVRAALTGLRRKGHPISRHVEGNTTVWSTPSAAEADA